MALQSVYEGTILWETESRSIGERPQHCRLLRMLWIQQLPQKLTLSKLIDTDVLEVNQDFSALPDITVIFITENDIYRDGAPRYQVARFIRNRGMKGFRKKRSFRDGTQIIYINGTYRGNNAIGRLMHDFNCSDPDEMYDHDLAARVRYLKQTQEGIEEMCRISEELENAAMRYGEQKGIKIGEERGEQRAQEAAISALMKNLNITRHEAMSLLGIATES